MGLFIAASEIKPTFNIPYAEYIPVVMVFTGIIIFIAYTDFDETKVDI